MGVVEGVETQHKKAKILENILYSRYTIFNMCCTE